MFRANSMNAVSAERKKKVATLGLNTRQPVQGRITRLSIITQMRTKRHSLLGLHEDEGRTRADENRGDSLVGPVRVAVLMISTRQMHRAKIRCATWQQSGDRQGRTLAVTKVAAA